MKEFVEKEFLNAYLRFYVEIMREKLGIFNMPFVTDV
jgi:hypothetical protein